MEDFLLKKCNTMRITLIYTQNKITVLSSMIVNNIPMLRVHRMFKNCDEKTAKAIINIYTKPEIDNTDIEIINNYIKLQNPDMNYKIKPPDEIFKSFFKNLTDNTSDNATESSQNLVELNILSIEVESFMGKASSNESKNSIKPSEDDVLELNIIVDPLNTKYERRCNYGV